MWKVTLIVVMSIVGWVSLDGAHAMTKDAGVVAGVAEAVGAADTASLTSASPVSATAPRRVGSVRICFGPARIDLGGTPFTRLTFGGEGCGRPVSPTFAIRLGGRDAAARSGTTLPHALTAAST